MKKKTKTPRQTQGSNDNKHKRLNIIMALLSGLLLTAAWPT